MSTKKFIFLQDYSVSAPTDLGRPATKLFKKGDIITADISDITSKQIGVDFDGTPIKNKGMAGGGYGFIIPMQIQPNCITAPCPPMIIIQEYGTSTSSSLKDQLSQALNGESPIYLTNTGKKVLYGVIIGGIVGYFPKDAGFKQIFIGATLGGVAFYLFTQANIMGGNIPEKNIFVSTEGKGLLGAKDLNQ